VLCLFHLKALVKDLGRLVTYSYKPITKKKAFYCNTAQPMYILENEERQNLTGTFNYYTILQLKSFCQKADGRDKIPYVQTFTQLRNK
jgi:hypothetical protein